MSDQPHESERPTSAAGAIDVIYELGCRLRFNTRSKKREVYFIPADNIPQTVIPHRQWVPYIDQQIGAWLRTIAEERFTKKLARGLAPWRVSREVWEDAVDTFAQVNQVDDFIEWIKEGPEWDGVDRIENLGLILKAPDDEITKWFGRTLTTGALQLALDPNNPEIHETAILTGVQGCGKSSFLKALLPRDEHPAWYNTIKADVSNRELVERTKQAVVVELEEMERVRSVDVSQLKSTVSRGGDTLRLSYRRDEEYVQARYILVGTSNEENPVPYDPTGSRRWVAIKCGNDLKRGLKVRSAIAEVQEQIWAEAWHKYHSDDYGPEWKSGNMPEHLIEDVLERNQDFMWRNEPLYEALEEMEPWEGGLRAAAFQNRLKQALAEIDPHARPSNQAKAEAFKELGFTQRREGPNKQRVWYHPKYLQLEEVA